MIPSLIISSSEALLCYRTVCTVGKGHAFCSWFLSVVKKQQLGMTAAALPLQLRLPSYATYVPLYIYHLCKCQIIVAWLFHTRSPSHTVDNL